MRLFTCLVLALSISINVSGREPTRQSSPAQEKIKRLEETIDRNPTTPGPYNQLAWALSSRARETSDPSFYDQAEAVLQKSRELDPGSYEALKIRVWVLLGKHEFQKALEEAERLRKRFPDDVMVYGFLVDANTELGNYKEAEEAAQWMLDLRPGNVAGLTRAAYLRELFGDLEGAIQFMQLAYQRTAPQETENLAWISTHVGRLCLMSGKIKAAERALHQALAHFPNYHYALGELAKVRQVQKRFNEAVGLLRQRYAQAPHPENLYQLAETLMKAGRRREAGPLLLRFEQDALAETDKPDNANRELIFHLAHRNPAKALEIAQREFGRRRDVYTLDAYAWALYRNGRKQEARRHMQTALAVGVKDPDVLYRAREVGSRVSF